MTEITIVNNSRMSMFAEISSASFYRDVWIMNGNYLKCVWLRQ